MLADGLFNEQLPALHQLPVQLLVVLNVRRHDALDALAAAQSGWLAEDGLRPGAELPQPRRVGLTQVEKPPLQQVCKDGIKLDLVVELIEIRRVVHLPGQRLVLHGGHIRFPHRAVPLGKAKHVIIQIPDAVAHLAPHHVAEDEEAVLPRLLMDGVDVELQPRQAQMLQLPEKGSDLSSHSPFLRFPDFPVTAGRYAAAAR